MLCASRGREDRPRATFKTSKPCEMVTGNDVRDVIFRFKTVFWNIPAKTNIAVLQDKAETQIRPSEWLVPGWSQSEQTPFCLPTAIIAYQVSYNVAVRDGVDLISGERRE